MRHKKCKNGSKTDRKEREMRSESKGERERERELQEMRSKEEGRVCAGERSVRKCELQEMQANQKKEE